MILINVRMALSSIRSAKVRSFLTMLGVIIGVMSVVMIVSIGEGVKNQVLGQITKLGTNVITVTPGKPNKRAGSLQGIRINTPMGTSTLVESDIEAISKIPGVVAVSPNAMITSEVSSVENTDYDGGIVYATTLETKNVLNQSIEFGEFFASSDTNKDVAVIGSSVASDLYHQRDPIGRVITIKGREFIVRGVLSTATENPLNIGASLNNAIYIPFDAGKRLSNNTLQISEFNIKVSETSNLNNIGNQVRDALYNNHNNQEDFTLTKQTHYINLANQLFTILTTLVAAVAGISLIVGGIGIMNIMLVSVSERTREIGVRKAIGATNHQILSQFLVEAIVISLLGGIIGVLLSMAAAFVIRITTSVHPSISLKTVLVAIAVSTVVGVVFGMMPAIRAARKDPIEALRHQ